MSLLISDRPMECAAEHGAAAVQVLVAAFLSAQRGHRPVALPLVAPADIELLLPVT